TKVADLHARDDMRAQRTFSGIGEGFVRADGGRSSISDTMSIPARFFALNYAQSVGFCRFWRFLVTFLAFLRSEGALIRPSATFSRREKGLRRVHRALKVRCSTHFAAFSLDFRLAIFKLLVSRETGVGCWSWSSVRAPLRKAFASRLNSGSSSHSQLAD
ncbi:MAG: hypothetical protein WEB58_01085, partial [Planctomycetaceae bacterium]